MNKSQRAAEALQSCFESGKQDENELIEYRSIGPVEEFRALKEAEQKRRETDSRLLNTAGEYAAKFAENHGMSIVEAMEQPMVRARFSFFADTGM